MFSYDFPMILRVGEIDRRALMIQNQRHIDASPFLRNIVAGTSSEAMADLIDKNKKQDAATAHGLQ